MAFGIPRKHYGKCPYCNEVSEVIFERQDFERDFIKPLFFVRFKECGHIKQYKDCVVDIDTGCLIDIKYN